MANLNRILEANHFLSLIRAKLIRWDDLSDCDSEKFDTVICADCLFFQEFRSCLVDCIYYLLRPGGRALITAPRRGTSLENFIELSSKRFIVHSEDNYSKKISTRKSALKDDDRFNEDKDYPLLIRMEKIPKSNL